jgi:Glycosyl hydrolases family 25/Putative peptidoglycan binding domain
MLLPDISEYQPGADIPGIKKQTPAIILRVGYGHDHKDNFISRWRPEAESAGFRFIGLYHYLRGDQDAASQAQIFCSWVGHLNKGEIPILDIEVGSGDQSKRAQAWFNVVDPFFRLDLLPLNRRSWIYSYPSFIAATNLGQFFQSARRSWLAAYQSTQPATPPHTLWQSTNGVTGANRTNWAGAGFCDTNYTSHTIDELAAMAWQPTPTPPPTPPGWTEDIVQDLPTLRQGSTGNDVRTMQGLLVARGHPTAPGTSNLGVDGIFGQQTEAVVISVQRGWGLPADGVVGPKTWAKLLNR